jgi:hypothetical protein
MWRRDGVLKMVSTQRGRVPTKREIMKTFHENFHKEIENLGVDFLTAKCYNELMP